MTSPAQAAASSLSRACTLAADRQAAEAADGSRELYWEDPAVHRGLWWCIWGYSDVLKFHVTTEYLVSCPNTFANHLRSNVLKFVAVTKRFIGEWSLMVVQDGERSFTEPNQCVSRTSRLLGRIMAERNAAGCRALARKRGLTMLDLGACHH